VNEWDGLFRLEKARIPFSTRNNLDQNFKQGNVWAGYNEGIFGVILHYGSLGIYSIARFAVIIVNDAIRATNSGGYNLKQAPFGYWDSRSQ
jgi:hypothetical protein